MDRHMAAALDDYITGHGGEDQFAGEGAAMTRTWTRTRTRTHYARCRFTNGYWWSGRRFNIRAQSWGLTRGAGAVHASR